MECKSERLARQSKRRLQHAPASSQSSHVPLTLWKLLEEMDILRFFGSWHWRNVSFQWDSWVRGYRVHRCTCEVQLHLFLPVELSVFYLSKELISFFSINLFTFLQIVFSLIECFSSSLWKLIIISFKARTAIAFFYYSLFIQCFT